MHGDQWPQGFVAGIFGVGAGSNKCQRRKNTDEHGLSHGEKPFSAMRSSSTFHSASAMPSGQCSLSEFRDRAIRDASQVRRKTLFLKALIHHAVAASQARKQRGENRGGHLGWPSSGRVILTRWPGWTSGQAIPAFEAKCAGWNGGVWECFVVIFRVVRTLCRWCPDELQFAPTRPPSLRVAGDPLSVQAAQAAVTGHVGHDHRVQRS